jgi:hypothetical protein
MDHPHIHCIVTGGGLSADGGRWVPCRKGSDCSNRRREDTGQCRPNRVIPSDTMNLYYLTRTSRNQKYDSYFKSWIKK